MIEGAAAGREAARPASLSLPPRARTADGRMRTVGVEIEFGEVPAAAAAELLRALYGGEIETVDPYRFRVATGLGVFTAELDWSYAHDWKRPAPEEIRRMSFAAEMALELEPLVGAVGSAFWPTEVSTPPVRIDRLGEIEAMLAGLRQAGASGADRLLHAFGLHLNPEVAAFDEAYLVAHLRAYLLLSERLRRAIGIPFSRRLAPFIAPFPARYRDLVLDPAYAPDRAALIDHYLAYNPTRNRELDMLPLFALLDPERVAQVSTDKRNKPRPTFHYRLPTSRIDEPGWTLRREWDRWVAVERLADDATALADAMRAYAAHRAGRLPGAWADLAGRWADV